MSSEAIRAVTSDLAGRTIVLTEERWAHICDGHPELEQHLDDLLRAVAEPTARLPGRGDQEEWFYLSGVGPSRWLKVVVRFDESGRGRIITAFARRRKP